MIRFVLLVFACPSVLLAALAVNQSESRSHESDAKAAVRDALKPLQPVVGSWRGNTFRENVVHEASWAWDYKTDPLQPALVMKAAKNPFFREARLTFDPVREIYVLSLVHDRGDKRKLEGTFVEPPKDVPGDDGRSLQRTYQLQLDQVEPKTGERWQIVLNQQENNRILIELAKRRGTAAFRRFDTISEQREGTSFALTDEGYGEKTCIISGGLGTMTVSHKGQTFYVCCSGCKAAFEEDPEKWIAEAKLRSDQK